MGDKENIRVSIVKLAFTKSARKQYVCDYCGDAINIGDAYYRGYATINNLSFEFFACEKCKSAVLSIVEDNYRVDNKILFNAYTKKYHGVESNCEI